VRVAQESQRIVFAILRRIPAWVYVAVLVIGFGLFAETVYQLWANSQAAAAYAQTANDLLRSPIAGMTYEVKVYKWSPEMQLLPSNGPLTTADSYSFEMTPEGSDCAKSSIRQVTVQFLSPAFSVEPSNRLDRDMPTLQHNYCVASPSSVTVNYHWDVLARQEGHHVVALRVSGLDEKGRQVSEDTVEVPIIVSNNPFTLARIIATVGALGGFIGVVFTIADRFTRSRRGASQSKPGPS
jgi:hypothetical protein